MDKRASERTYNLRNSPGSAAPSGVAVSGEISVRVNRLASLDKLESSALPRESRPAHRTWSGRVVFGASRPTAKPPPTIQEAARPELVPGATRVGVLRVLARSGEEPSIDHGRCRDGRDNRHQCQKAALGNSLGDLNCVLWNMRTGHITSRRTSEEPPRNEIFQRLSPQCQTTLVDAPRQAPVTEAFALDQCKFKEI